MLRAGSSAGESESEDEVVPRMSLERKGKRALSSVEDNKEKKSPKAKKPRVVSASIESRLNSNNDIRESILLSTQRRIAFLLENKDLFLHLLPDDKNFFTKLPPTKVKTAIPFELVETPIGVKATMKDYQLRGLSYLVMLYRNGMNGILGDEMGLGKTLQTLSLFSYVRQDGAGGPFLVICPLSVLSSWMTEAKRWVPDLTVMCFHGTVAERDRLKHEYTRIRADILVTSYEQYVSENHWFKTITWKYVVLDEGHKIKNEKTNVSTTLRGLSSQYRLLLTGTPLQNNLHELWALFHWLFPEVFTDATAKKFDDSFNLTKGTYDVTILTHARRLLEKVMLRRMKAQVDFQIPPKEEITLYVPISPMQRFWYKRLLTRLDTMTLQDLFSTGKSSNLDGQENKMAASEMNHLEETKAVMEYSMQSGGGDWKRMMNLVMQLRKCCNHPYMLPNSEPEPFITGEHIVLASSKMILLDKLLKHLRKGGHRTLLFSGFTGMLDILEDFMIFRNVPYCRLDGSTARPRRTLDIRLFQHKESPYEVFLISTRAGGLGINLTSADTVIFFDNDWNPQVDIQALARAHRIGQTKPVTVYRLVCQDTVEEQMLGRLQKKLYLSAKVTEDMQDPHPGAEPSFSKGELMSMLRRGARAVTRIFDDNSEFVKSDIEHILEKSREYQLKVEEEIDVDVEDDFKLEGMEQVQSRLFEGETHHKSKKDIGREWQELTKRAREERTILIDGHAVLKETVGCEGWEARSTFSKGHVEPPKKTKRRFEHESVCSLCSEPMTGANRLECKLCPRALHPKCAGISLKAVDKFLGFKCPQHRCVTCDKSTADAGGLLFRCQSCPNAYCEDCNNWDEMTPLGDVLPEFLLLDFPKVSQAYFIRCPECNAHYAENPDQLKTLEAQTAKDWEAVERGERVEAEEQSGLVTTPVKTPKGKAKKARSLNAPKSNAKHWPSQLRTRVMEVLRLRRRNVGDLESELGQFGIDLKRRGNLKKVIDGSSSAPLELLENEALRTAVEEWTTQWEEKVEKD
ncbi:SNF2 family N-terminal domain-containing protein [Powellomyces hirtus]|nr:SNF2 family N-terminal domain-containing protein [Powellomyces hirtus]